MIGVFDSGFGGLTVHRALIDALPARDFVYLGDNRNAPYGVRPPIEVLNLTCAALERLFAEGCTLAVVACNTASTVALRWIQQQWLPVRRRSDGIARNVIGIVVPYHRSGHRAPARTKMARRCHKPSRPAPSRFSPLAAPSKVTAILPRSANAVPTLPWCSNPARSSPGLSNADGPATNCAASSIVMSVSCCENSTPRPESVILGCTHYPLVADLFAAALPPSVRMIHQPEATAHALKAYLDRHPEYDGSHAGRRKFLSTGFSAEALPLIEKFWGDKVPFVQGVNCRQPFRFIINPCRKPTTSVAAATTTPKLQDGVVATAEITPIREPGCTVFVHYNGPLIS
ncbi:MAG: glutamate racemase [Ignavibacteriota bacterium]